MSLAVEKYEGTAAVVMQSVGQDYAEEVGRGLDKRLDHDTKIDALEIQFEKGQSLDLDITLAKLVSENIALGSIDKFRHKLFGMRGDGGYWGDIRIVEKRKGEPVIYGNILIKAMDGFGQMSEKGGKMPLSFYQELCEKAMELAEHLGSGSDKKMDIFRAIVRMTELGSKLSDKLRLRLAMIGISSSNLKMTEIKNLEPLVKNIVQLYK